MAEAAALLDPDEPDPVTLARDPDRGARGMSSPAQEPPR